MSEWPKNYTEEQLKIRVHPEKWSAFQNMVHLAAYQPTFIQRMTAILNQEYPVFGPYKADNDPAFHVYLGKTPAELISDVGEKRLDMIRLLGAASDQQLPYWGEHAKYGKLSVPDWTEFFLLHEAHHLFTSFLLIRQISK
jgi:hypothetical protein